MSNTRQRLIREITALEEQLSERPRHRRQSNISDERAVLAAEISELENKINDMKVSTYMDDDLGEDEDYMGYMDDDEEDMDFMDDDLDDDLDDDMSYMRASETDPGGIEEEIDQDYLDDVARLQGKQSLADESSILQVAPTRSEYQRKLASASGRLDRVAQYLEQNGRSKLAFRIDKIADAVDSRLSQLGGNNHE